MATLLDTTLLLHFLPFFVFIFIFTVLFAVLKSTELLSKNDSLNFIAALSIALVSLFVQPAIDLISFVVPWFAFLFIFLTLLFAVFLFLGKSKQDIWDTLNIWTILIVIFLILLVGFVTVFEELFTPYEESDDGKTIGGQTLKTLFHPRVLGAIFILIIASLAIKLISKEVA